MKIDLEKIRDEMAAQIDNKAEREVFIRGFNACNSALEPLIKRLLLELGARKGE